MAFVNTVDVVGDQALAASVVDRSVTEIADNVITILVESALQGCKNLTKIDFPSLTKIGDNAVRDCEALTALILRGETVCALTSNFTLNGTPINYGAGYIYVPAALVDTYKAATNWSTKVSKFRALESYTVDGTTTGELDPTKI